MANLLCAGLQHGHYLHNAIVGWLETPQPLEANIEVNMANADEQLAARQAAAQAVAARRLRATNYLNRLQAIYKDTMRLAFQNGFAARTALFDNYVETHTFLGRVLRLPFSDLFVSPFGAAMVSGYWCAHPTLLLLS